MISTFFAVMLVLIIVSGVGFIVCAALALYVIYAALTRTR